MSRMEDWTDEQWQECWDAIDRGKENRKHSEPMSQQDKDDLKKYLRDPEGWMESSREKARNRDIVEMKGDHVEVNGQRMSYGEYDDWLTNQGR
jgi:hypothetical protein